MRKYQIYLMDTEIAYLYFGKESKLFHLFLEEQSVTGKQRKIIKKQIDYIIRPIPAILANQAIDQSLRFHSDYYCHRDSHCINISSPSSKAKLTVHDNKMTVEAEGSYEAETMFFEVLRKIAPCFLAMDFENYRYGWLNPIKQAELI